jgi:ubiquitin-activating enzyme E1
MVRRDTWRSRAGLFKQAAEDANSYITDADYVKKLKTQPGTALTTLEGVRDNLVAKRPKTFDDCVVWARLKFEELYVNNIKQLLFNFPLDMVTAGGTPFWSGPKRPPSVATFNADEALHLGFITAAANMRASLYAIPQCRDQAAILAALTNVMVPEFVPQRGVKIQVNEAEAAAAAASGGDVDEMALDAIAAALPPPASLAKLHPVEFEKDDDSNFHMDFITACSNLRASNYSIANADRYQVPAPRAAASLSRHSG